MAPDARKTNGKPKKPSAPKAPTSTEVSNGSAAPVPAIIKPPEGFLPFSHNVITPALAAHAALNLNETEETRTKGLQEMREILKNDVTVSEEMHFVLNSDDKFLLLFLRSRKFDVKRSVEFLKLGMQYVESYKHLLERDDPAVIRKVLKANMIGFLPYRDEKGRAIIYSRADAWDYTTISAADAIFGGVVGVQTAAHNPVNQVAGFVVVLDLKDLKIQQVLAMSRWMIFGTITLQKACPCFMKAFHVINVPPIYKIGWKIVKPLLSEKMRKRFIFHKSSDLTTLYEYLPKEILPPELGGPIPFSNEHWASDMESIEKEYYNYLNIALYSRRKKSTASN